LGKKFKELMFDEQNVNNYINKVKDNLKEK